MKLFCILGMHRSGTSAIARIVNLLGASLGSLDDLMEPKADNPMGFWESRAIVHFHDDLLGQLGGRWDQPPFRDDGWELSPGLEEFRQRARTILESHFSNADVCAWKDPRGCLLLPLWREVISISGVILVTRDPEEVAGSLLSRDQFPVEKSAKLWLRYMSSAWRYARTHLLVNYQDVLRDPIAEAIRIAHYTGLPEPTPQTQAVISTFVNPELCHQVSSKRLDGQELRLAAAFSKVINAQDGDVAGPMADLLHDRFKAVAHLEETIVGSSRLLEQLDRGRS